MLRCQVNRSFQACLLVSGPTKLELLQRTCRMHAHVQSVLCPGSLPNSFSSLTMLAVLDLAKSDSYTRGRYDGKIFEILNSSDLEYLHIYGNEFSGSKDSLDVLPNLKTLLMHKNQV